MAQLVQHATERPGDCPRPNIQVIKRFFERVRACSDHPSRAGVWRGDHEYFPPVGRTTRSSSRPSRRLRRLTPYTVAHAMKLRPTRVAMGARTLGRLTPRQRVVAVVLIALIIAAGIYRGIVFGNVNTLHGSSTVHTLTGESEVFPTSTEVQAGARSLASREGKVTDLSCRQVLAT
jgi:hypothetical protein